MNSGAYYLQFFDPQSNRFVESNNFFSFSRFGNPSIEQELPYLQFTSNNPADQAFQNGYITSGQATGIGLQVITTGVGDQTITRVLSGPSYTYPYNNYSSSRIGCINGITYIRVAITGMMNNIGPVITGYYIAIDANPGPCV